MLSQQESAWVVYSAIFLFFTIFLSLRCRKNMLLIPFVIFGMLISIGSICLLAAHSGLSTTINTAIASAASNNINFSLNRYWQGKSLTLSLLPAASFLLFLGIMEAEIIFIRHLAVALNNRERWSSIYLRDPEKSSGFAQPKAKKSSLRPWTYWVSFILLAIYLVVAMVSVIVETTMEDTSKDLGVAICVSMLWFISGLNVFVIWCSCNSSANHVRTIRRNRDDLKFLRFTPILFFVLITGVLALSWIYYAIPTVSMTLWILLETFSVYVPLLFIMLMCIYTGKIQTMGRQYPIEAAQQAKFQRSYQTQREIQSVTKKLSQEESNRYSSPPPAYRSQRIS